MPQVNVSKQTINTLIILVGSILLIYDFVVEPQEVYFKISGLVVLMFGLYKSTQQWTADNKTEEKDNQIEDDFDEDVDFDQDNPEK
jgi:hypothetical protein